LNGSEPGLPIIFLLGPTAVGKTLTAIELARMINAEIISLDSRQVYRGLDIGTAKPTLRQRRDVPHHLVDILTLDEDISAGRYRELALAAIAATHSRGRHPLFVGGSGLYANALIKGLFESSQTDPGIRRQLHLELQTKGSAALYNRLLEIDPATALKTHLNDHKRITRALEIYAITGQPPSQHYRHQNTPLPFPYQVFILNMPREELYRRIDQRVQNMLSEGLVEEVRRLIAAGGRARLEQLLTLGYQEVLHFLDGHCTEEEMGLNIQRNTRRYAKRQLTWFRNQYPEAVWVEVAPDQSPHAVAEIIRNSLTKIN